jgi:single-stranded DNA-binding protein
MSSSTEYERRNNMSTTQKTLNVKLYGNLGGDPELRSTRDQVITRSVYDPLLDDAVEREFQKPGREFLTFSIAVNAKDAEGQPLPTRWHRCIDWNGLTATYRKGDRVALSGFFKVRTYEKDGETKQIRELVVTGAQILRLKVREQAA